MVHSLLLLLSSGRWLLLLTGTISGGGPKLGIFLRDISLQDSQQEIIRSLLSWASSYPYQIYQAFFFQTSQPLY